MATTSPALIPPAGLRALSAKEQLQRAAALNCVAEGAGKPACVGQVFVGVFFDGTGNNKKLDFDDPPPEKRKHTNVVKLLQAVFGRNLLQRGRVIGCGRPLPRGLAPEHSSDGHEAKRLFIGSQHEEHPQAPGVQRPAAGEASTKTHGVSSEQHVLYRAAR